VKIRDYIWVKGGLKTLPGIVKTQSKIKVLWSMVFNFSIQCGMKDH